MSNLSKRTSIQRLWIKASTDGGQASSTFIDMQGWDGAMLFLTQGATAIGSTGSVKVRNSSDASTGGAYVVTKTSGCTWGSSGWSGLVFDCYRPLKRYLSVQPAMTSGQMMGWAIKYCGRRQGSTEADLVKSVNKVFTIAMTS
jgi:hypothetical protein